VSKDVLKRFPFAELVVSSKVLDFKTGLSIQIKILKTTFHHPYIRIREERDSSGALVRQKEVVANKLLVTLAHDSDPHPFLRDLMERTLRNDTDMTLLSENESTYQLIFPAEIDLLPMLLKAAKPPYSLKCMAYLFTYIFTFA
jgi:hypothetical protein